jgi:hypothetical protein
MTVLDPTARSEAVFRQSPRDCPVSALRMEAVGVDALANAHRSKSMCLTSWLSGHSSGGVQRVGAISIMWGMNYRSAAIRRFLEDGVR